MATSTPSEQISVGNALAHLAVARAFRQTCVITHRSVATGTLYCRIIENNDELLEDAPGIVCEAFDLKIVVTANQATFQYAGVDQELVVEGDQVTVNKYTGRIYSVVAPITLDNGGRTYRLRLQEKKRLASGVG